MEFLTCVGGRYRSSWSLLLSRERLVRLLGSPPIDIL